MRSQMAAVATLLLLLAAACAPDQATAPSEERRGAPTISESSISLLFPPRNIQDEFRTLSYQYPGFTGFSLDEDQNPVITHAGSPPSEHAQQQIVSWASRSSAGYISASAKPRLVRVKYDYLTLDATQRAALRALRNRSPWS